MTRLITDRLTMRCAQPSDLDALHMLVSNFEVVKMTSSWPWPADRAFTATRAVPFDKTLGVVGLVFHHDELVGSMGMTSTTGETPEMGYMFGSAHWGKGYATEMGRAMIVYCWEAFDWDEISACVFDDNEASDRVLVKLGFEFVGPCRGYSRARGKELPTRTYRLPRP
ncbi:GNAT family N-acetyltransferase [Aliiroseovarius sp. KMU-50]|uniref:GNAT family N-acetyltransferase n=1 Tax=Aliiroseovarius salicola TaxID=3009082 RepID=A0ABT4W534_9RHOB|nr:GNAT family N-acetyltransferase [Aliiroseovarius sp. KMU-50]MDA5094937.1 GNAT family N-acetyltransferase [Aliiroseovarius sp. KMU-50]